MGSLVSLLIPVSSAHAEVHGRVKRRFRTWGHGSPHAREKREIAASILLLLTISGCSPSAPYTIINDTIPTSLTSTPGDAARGLSIFVERERGHCVLCHQVTGLGAEFQGNVGPSMDGIGARLTPAQMRLRIVDASALNANTVMPPYYRTHGLNQVGAAYENTTVLSAQDIEDLVTYLSGLEDVHD